VPNFISLVTFIAELAHGEKSRTQSINRSLNHPVTHPPSLFDTPGTEAFASEKNSVKFLSSANFAAVLMYNEQ